MVSTIICSNYTLLAQQGSLKGRLEGLTTGELPVLNLVTAKDSQLVKTTIPDSTGRFDFNQLKTGSYFLHITHIGYQSYQSGYQSYRHSTDTKSKRAGIRKSVCHQAIHTKEN
ncbi:MAG TPA: carboxypeptidase-like regulatory domain-containing protein [Niabella sp.]|nr:carboxypeptidase-like regulatory domain-containing protein [Niabella sp.]